MNERLAPGSSDGSGRAPPEGALDEALEREFPPGDGTAATEADGSCPYCGERVSLAVDPGGGARQAYVEDCPVCCRPWSVRVRWDAAGAAAVELSREDEG